jgi:uncharacterized protein YndB with AHSA1/START domain
MSLSKPPSAIADIEEGMILAAVEIAVPPERVFEALFNEQDVVRWWGSEDVYRTTGWQADVRPGGKWHADGEAKDGHAFRVEGEFTEVEAPHKVTFTWRADWDGFSETHVTYLLEAVEEGTRLTLRHEGFADRVASCRNHTSGWERVLGWLAADLQPKAAPAHYFLFKLLPPRTTFPQDITPEERTIMGAHVGYWSGKLAEGKILAFGPVADPAGSWGVGLMRVQDPAEVRPLTAQDPVILADRGFRYEVLPMPRAIHA